MATCATLGWRARYIGSFGDDDLGALSRESLTSHGVDISAARTVAGATNQFAVILVDARSGERTVLWDRHPGAEHGAGRRAAGGGDVGPAADRRLPSDARRRPARRATRAKRGSRPSSTSRRCRPGIADLLQHIDAIIAAEDFPAALTGHEDLGRALEVMGRDSGASLVCVTLGERGQPGLVQRPRDPDAAVPGRLRRQHRRGRRLSRRFRRRLPGDARRRHRGCPALRQRRRGAQLPGARAPAGRCPTADEVEQLMLGRVTFP